MNRKSILESIKTSVDTISWSSETKKQKAIHLCASIFNLYIFEHKNFYDYLSLSREYFTKSIKTKTYVKEIKDNLINNGIIEVNHSYNVSKGIGKGYRFNQSLIYQQKTITFKTIPICVPTDSPKDAECYPMLPYEDMKTYVVNGLDRLSFKNEVYTYINEFKITIDDLEIDNNIDSQFISLIFDNKKYRYRKEKAIEFAHSIGKQVIKYNKGYSVDTIEDFIPRKEMDIKIFMSKSVYDITNKIFRVIRNETNNRLDYNLTNMKSELMNYLLIDGEELVELDIANAQFAILSHLNNNLDKEFIKISQEGNLYSHIGDKIGIKPKKAKEFMFRIAFDKIKEDQDKIRNIFPQTMKFIDSYKEEYGYKGFSNLLQKTESYIMIDGLFNHMIKSKHTVFTIHDALRVRKSELELMRKEIQEYFDSINFKCKLRIKNKNNS